MPQNPYETLNVSRDASDDDIKVAFKNLAKKYHPDRNPASEEKFKEISNAYDQIKKERSGQQQYDSSSVPANHTFDDLNKMFSDMYARQNARNADVTIHIAITLEAAFNGSTVALNLNVENMTKNIDLRIPAGSTRGSILRVAGQYDQIKTLPPGNLVVLLVTVPHDRFTLADNCADLIMTLKVNALDVVVGCKKQIEGIDKKQVLVTIPSGHDPHKALKVPGHGMKVGETNSVRGDLYIIVDAIFDNVTTEQRNKIQEIL